MNRRVLLCSSRVKGYYKFEDLLQILPPEEHFPKLDNEVGDHPFIIEIKSIVDQEEINKRRNKYKESSIPRYEKFVVTDLINELFDEILSLLQFFSHDNIIYIGNNGEQTWFVPLYRELYSELSVSCLWGQRMYCSGKVSESEEFTEHKYPKMELISPQKYYNYGCSRPYQGTSGKNMSLPSPIDIYLSIYFNLEDIERIAFLSSIKLYTIGCKVWNISRSLSFAALISSIETLIAFNNKEKGQQRCKKCGNIIPILKCNDCNTSENSLTSNFKGFLKNHGIKYSDVDTFAGKIYNIRSRILHDGLLLLTENKYSIYESVKIQEQEDIHLDLIRTARCCIINWLLKRENNPMIRGF